VLGLGSGLRFVFSMLLGSAVQPYIHLSFVSVTLQVVDK